MKQNLEMNALDIVRTELNNLIREQQIKVKQTNSSISIVCPFHKDDVDPSLSLNLDSSKGVPIGWGKCWGCGWNNHWNVLAAHFNLIGIKSWQQQAVSNDIDLSFITDSVFKEDTLDSLLTSEKIEFTMDWDKNLNWRGITGQVLQDIGALLSLDNKNNTMIILPVQVNSSSVGIIKAKMTKVAGELSYINSSGGWTKDKGLFPFNYVKQNIKNTNTLYIVEGPRDALALIQQGFFAVSVLGSQNISDNKARLITSFIDAKEYCILGDGDLAGHKMNHAFKVMMLKYTEDVKAINLPLNKGYDPANLPSKFISQLR